MINLKIQNNTITSAISYRKPATVAHKFIDIKKFAPKGTTFQGHRNKF